MKKIAASIAISSVMGVGMAADFGAESAKAIYMSMPKSVKEKYAACANGPELFDVGSVKQCGHILGVSNRDDLQRKREAVYSGIFGKLINLHAYCACESGNGSGQCFDVYAKQLFSDITRTIAPYQSHGMQSLRAKIDLLANKSGKYELFGEGGFTGLVRVGAITSIANDIQAVSDVQFYDDVANLQFRLFGVENPSGMTVESVARRNPALCARVLDGYVRDNLPRGMKRTVVSVEVDDALKGIFK